ncbi:MAG: hypothetical protein V5A87_07030 [Candidatus Bipolaricaulota bacterium]|nr:hypothetical protein [Candidatus Bipolaricaulota bacterium]
MINLKHSKTILFVVVFFFAFIVLSNILIDRSSTLSTFSYDGYKDLNKGETIIITSSKRYLKHAAIVLPREWKENLSAQITFPRLVGEGMRRITVKPEGNNLVFASLMTKPLQKTYSEKRYTIPHSPDLTPLLSPETNGVNGINPTKHH